MLYAAIGLVSTLSGEFASARVQKIVRVGNLIPHLSAWTWAAVGLALLFVLGVEGAVREFRRLDAERENEVSRLRGEHAAALKAALDAQRDQHQDAINAAHTAALASRADGMGRPDPTDWTPGCECSPAGILTFTLRHRRNNFVAVQSFSDFRCEVTDPEGVRTEASGPKIYSAPNGPVWGQYPSSFPGAPPVRSGTYRFAWTGKDAKGTWQEITRGSHEVLIPADGDPANVDGASP